MVVHNVNLYFFRLVYKAVRDCTTNYKVWWSKSIAMLLKFSTCQLKITETRSPYLIINFNSITDIYPEPVCGKVILREQLYIIQRHNTTIM